VSERERGEERGERRERRDIIREWVLLYMKGLKRQQNSCLSHHKTAHLRSIFSYFNNSVLSTARK
jgi:hypothetical protein